MRQVALSSSCWPRSARSCPATRARIGLVDAVYTRIGAVDDPAGGRSTFMVEMEETAGVLRGATDRSLVLLDELGRGTSTHDGMAIAWAVIEHLAAGPARPRAIVATHYHELAALGTAYPQLTLLRAAVEERADRVVFTHRIEPGAADRSFGIEVARLAGLPGPLLARAREVAEAIEPLSAEIAGRLGGLGRPGRGPARAAAGDRLTPHRDWHGRGRHGQRVTAGDRYHRPPVRGPAGTASATERRCHAPELRRRAQCPVGHGWLRRSPSGGACRPGRLSRRKSAEIGGGTHAWLPRRPRGRHRTRRSRPARVEVDRNGAFPEAGIAALGEAGLLGLTCAPEVGGGGEGMRGGRRGGRAPGRRLRLDGDGRAHALLRHGAARGPRAARRCARRSPPATT